MSKKHTSNDAIIDGLNISRRGFLDLAKGTGLISLSTLATTWTPRALAATNKINLVSWGGSYQAAQKLAVEEPYTKATGVAFQNIEKAGSGPALLTAQEQTQNIAWDVVDMLKDQAALLSGQGLLAELDYDKVLEPAPDGTPASEDYIPGSLGGDGKRGALATSISTSTVLAYNKKAFGNGHVPTSVKDVFDLKRFPGRRALEKGPTDNLEWALYADGVPRDKVYEVLSTPAGVDRAFRKLDTIKSHCVWWSEGAQTPQMLAQGDAVIGSDYNGRIFTSIVEDKQPLEFIWDGAVYFWDGWVIPAGLPKERLEAALRFVRYATSTKALANQARYIAYAPARKSALKMAQNYTYYKNSSVQMMPYMPTSVDHLKIGIQKNVHFWANYGPALTQRFSAWLAS